MVGDRTTRRLALAGLGAAIIVVTGCAGGVFDPSVDETARRAYAAFARGDDAAVAAMFEPAQRGPALLAGLAQLHLLVPKGPAPKAETVSWNTYAGTSGIVYTVADRYAYPQSTVTVTTGLVSGSAPHTWLLRSFNINVSVAQPAAAPGAGAAHP